MKLAIIVPYRDRRDELDIFIPHMEEFLTNKQIDYKIIVAEQSDDRPFNYGKLCNSVVNEIKDDYDYFCFHDINVLPISDYADYSYKNSPTHLIYKDNFGDIILPYEQFFGGAVIISKEDFIKSNGYSNDYWGKGYVDLDFLYRIEKTNLKLEKKYNYSNKQTLKLDLKDRNISKFVDEVVFEPKSYLRTINTDILAKNFTVSFYYQNSNQSYDSKTIIFRTFNGFDFQIFSIDKYIILQFFDENKEMFQIETDELDLLKLNHYTFIHSFDKKEIKIFLNGELHKEKNYIINYEYSKKNVILGSSENETKLKLLDFKVFDFELSNQEVKEEYYYGIDPNLFGLNKMCFYENLNTVLDNQMNVWNFIGPTKIDFKKKLKNNNIKNTPKRLKGEYKILSEKFSDIENTFNPDIIENRETYYKDLLSGKINIKKYGFNSVKYTLLTSTKFNENTEWLKIST